MFEEPATDILTPNTKETESFVGSSVLGGNVPSPVFDLETRVDSFFPVKKSQDLETLTTTPRTVAFIVFKLAKSISIL